MRMPAFVASARTWRSSSTPAGPISLKPAEMIIAPFTPALPQSCTMPGTVGGGVMMTARSGFAGTAVMLGYALTPSTVSRFGLTG